MIGLHDFGLGEFANSLPGYPSAKRHWSDADLFWIIQSSPSPVCPPGNPASPRPTLGSSCEFIHALPRLNAAPPAPVATLQTQQATQNAEAALVKYGKTLYRQEGCFTCHRLNGEGKRCRP